MLFRSIVNAVRTRVIPLDETKVVVTSSYYNGSTFVPWPLGGVPASAPSASAIPVRVSVCFPWSAVTFIGRFFPAVSPAPCGVSGSDLTAPTLSSATTIKLSDQPALSNVGGVALVTIDRQEALNAFSFDILDDLATELERLDADEACRAIVITGAGTRAFAAGADIRELAIQTPISQIGRAHV